MSNNASAVMKGNCSQSVHWFQGAKMPGEEDNVQRRGILPSRGDVGPDIKARWTVPVEVLMTECVNRKVWFARERMKYAKDKRDTFILSKTLSGPFTDPLHVETTIVIVKRACDVPQYILMRSISLVQKWRKFHVFRNVTCLEGQIALFRRRFQRLARAGSRGRSQGPALAFLGIRHA